MEGDWLTRLRWRRRGAWLWPSFVAAIALDAVIGHLLPASGDERDLLGAALAGAVLSLLAVVLLARPLGALIRRRRSDLPRIVARDYGGTIAIVAVTVALLAAGILNHRNVEQRRSAMREATARAQAFIGDRAPAEFRRNLTTVSTYAIEPGSIYRTCVPSAHGSRTYCVIVKLHAPLPDSVRFDGYESNAIFSAGAG